MIPCVAPVDRRPIPAGTREQFLRRLFARWQHLGWTLPSVRQNVAEQYRASGFHPQTPDRP